MSGVYTRVWIFLLALTGAEVLLAYVHAPMRVMVAALMALSIAKSALIIAWFMHMKQERRSLPLSLFPILIVCILALLMLLPDAANAQCVMCGRTAGAQNAERVRWLNRGIVVLVVPALTAIAGILWMAGRRRQ